MKEFEVNDFITLKLENGESNIYVNDELFNQCKYILVQRRVDDLTELSEAESIDELAFENLDHILEESNPENLDITEETQFWVHCSNLQVWAENNYDTRMLHSNLAFPLLKKLNEIGDPAAKRIFREEIAKRIETGFRSVVMYLIEEKYTDYLTREEFLSSLLNEDDADIIGALETEFGAHLTVTFALDDDTPNTFIVEDKKVIGIQISSNNLRNFNKLIPELKHVYILSMNGCQIKKLSDSIGQMKELWYLYLGNNLLKKIPESIGKLTKLRKLDLSNNHLTLIPESIGNLNKLRKLDLSNNKLTLIPESIGNLTNLRKLDLSNNHLTSIPESIGNIEFLSITY